MNDDGQIAVMLFMYSYIHFFITFGRRLGKQAVLLWIWAYFLVRTLHGRKYYLNKKNAKRVIEMTNT